MSTTDAQTISAATEKFSLKSEVDDSGQEREFIEGFVATTHTDKGNDRYTETALKQMAEDINGENVDAVFNDVDTEELREAQIGNLDHNNNPAAPFGDTRTVPAFKTTEAEVRDMSNGEQGLWIKALLNTDGMLPETVSAVKNSIKDGFLNALSVEFIAEKARRVKENDRVVRIIEEAKAKGAALTGRPMNPMAQLTDAELKSVAVEYEEVELKQDYTIQTPEYSATSESSWEKPAMEDFPEDYDVMSIFMARSDESDNFSDQALPVVDYRNGEATLVLEALRSAHQLASSVEGISEDEVQRVRNKAEGLAEEEFDVQLGSEGDSQHMDGKNDISTMSDDTQEASEEEVQDVEESGEEEETKSFSEDIEELKSMTQELKDTNEELREENDELKSELEDLRQLQEIKSEVDEVKSLLEEVELEDGPRARQEQKRFEEDEEEKAEWKKAADRLGEDYLKMEGKSTSNFEAFAENHGIEVEEVKNYVSTD